MKNITINTGFNAAGKTKKFDDLPEDEYVKISTDDIKVDIGNDMFKYQNRKLTKIKEDISLKINKKWEEAIIELDFPEVDFSSIRKTYDKHFQVDEIIKNLRNPIEDLPIITLNGLKQLNVAFQDSIQDIGDIDDTVLKNSLRNAIVNKINAWNKKWEESLLFVGITDVVMYDKVEPDNANLTSFFASLKQGALQKTKPQDFIDIKMWVDNWDKVISWSIFNIVKYADIENDAFLYDETINDISKHQDKYAAVIGDIMQKNGIFKNIVDINGKEIKIKEGKVLSNGQKAILKTVVKLAEAETFNKKVAIDDVFESMDNGSLESTIHFIKEQKSVSDFEIFTHNPLDLIIDDNDVKVCNNWISNDGTSYPGSPVLPSTLQKTFQVAGKSDDLMHILAITTRIMNRRHAYNSMYYHSNKKYKSRNHGSILWDKISIMTKNHKLDQPIHNFFASSKNFIKKITSGNSYDFSILSENIHTLLKGMKREKICGVSVKFLLEFWESMTLRFSDGEDELSNKYLHFLDDTMHFKNFKSSH